MAQRVVVFIDEQNVYRGARRAFFREADPSRCGNFSPMKLVGVLANRLPYGVKEDRVLQEVRIYTGLPSSTREPESYGAHLKRCQSWQASGATVAWRPLRYPKNTGPGEQKGVDVALAVDFVTFAINGQYDVGVLFSTDTDLAPALEFVARSEGTPKAEVACWWSPTSQSYLSIPGERIWSHRLSEADYKSVCDYTSYKT